MTTNRITGPGTLTIIWDGTSEYVRLRSADISSHGNGDSAPRHVDFEVQDCPQARINLMRALSGSPHRPTWFRLDLDNGDAVRFQGRLDKRPLPGPRNNRIRVSGSLTDAEGYETLEENPQFTFLAPDAKVWRYMTMAQFCNLGLTGKLHMQSIVHYIKDDPYEGLLPKSFGEFLQPELPYDPWQWLISSWCLSDYNNFALWHRYGDPQGVAIQTTIGKLKEGLFIGENGDRTGLFRIAYMDYGKDGILLTALPPGKWLQDERLPFLCKRREFEHEREVRLLQKIPEDKIAEWRIQRQEKANHFSDPIDNIACNLPVGPQSLVENVYAHPQSKRWVRETILGFMKSWKWQADFQANMEPKRKVASFVPHTATPEQP